LPSSTIGVSTLGYTGINYYFFLTFNNTWLQLHLV
jgi:hypothetical protein